MKGVAIAALACLTLGASVVLWAVFVGDPMGGEPVFVVKVDPQEDARRLAEATSEKAADDTDTRAAGGAGTGRESILSPGLMVGGVVGGGFPSHDSVRTVTLQGAGR